MWKSIHAKGSTAAVALALGAGMAGTVGLAACGGSDEGGGGAGSVKTSGEVTGGGKNLEGQPIKFGYLNGITGDYSSFAKPSLNGAQIAVEDVNNEGGVNGRPIKLVIQDDKSTAEGAVQGFQKLTEVDRVIAVAGVESDGGNAILDRTSEQQMPTLCTFCGTTELDKKGGDYMWRTAPSDTDIGIAAAQFARDAGYKKVAMIVQKTEGTLSPAVVFKQVFQDKVGGEFLNDVRFDPGKSTFQAEVQQVTEGDPDAIYMAIGHEAGVSVLREFERRGYDGHFFMSPDLILPETADFDFLASGGATGVVGAFDTSTPAYQHFAKRLKEEKGVEPSPGLGEPYYYDNYVILSLAATAAGKDLTSQKINAAIPDVVSPPGKKCSLYDECVALLKKGQEIDYQGASSSLDFNEYGNLARPTMAAMQIKDGKWVEDRVIAVDPSLRP